MDEKPKITHSVNKEFQKAAGQYESNVQHDEAIEPVETGGSEKGADGVTGVADVASSNPLTIASFFSKLVALFKKEQKPTEKIVDGHGHRINESKGSINVENHGDNNKYSVNDSMIIKLAIIILGIICLCLIVFAIMVSFRPSENENQISIENPTSSLTTPPPLITTEPSENTILPLTTTTTPDPTPSPSKTLQTTTTTPAATAATTSHFVQTQPTSSQQPQETEPTEPPKTTTVTQTEPPTDPPTDPPIIEGVDANGLAYRIENGTATITGYQGTVTEVVIPEYVAGVPVYAIGANAFANTEIASVELLAGVQRIEAEAFRGCTYLQQVILPISIKYIGPDAFTRNYDAESIFIYYRDSSVGWNQIEKTDADFEKDYIETSFNYGIEW